MSSIIYIIILIASIVIHELAHGFTADRLGDPTARLQGRLTLNPIAHLDMFGSLILPLLLVVSGAPFVFGWAKPVPFNPYNLKNPKWGGALVAVMGPISNFVIVAIAALCMHLFDLSAFWDSIIQGIMITNIALGVFNLLPIPPLDGHHILFALLPDSLDHIKDTLRRFAWPLIILFLMFGTSYLTPIIYGIYQAFI